MYDFWLGGKDHFAVDRTAALEVSEAAPEVKTMARVILSFRVRQGCELRHRVADGVVDAMAAVSSVMFQGSRLLPDRVGAERWSPSARASWRRSRAFSSARSWFRWRAAASLARREVSVARWLAGTLPAVPGPLLSRSRWTWMRMSGWV
jgi:hypothetical protein